MRECHLNNEQPDIQAELVCSLKILLEIAELSKQGYKDIFKLIKHGSIYFTRKSIANL